jgi:acetyl/propionyl-CoA carboxylase alpha subunit
LKTIKRVAIANRGEVAVRIINACQELDIETVLLHSEADTNSMAYRLADKRICIGPAPVSESYLKIENVINGAIAGQADAVHPGFGFLSENPDFAQAVLDNGMIFIGPSPEAMRQLGDKMRAKVLAKKLGVPLIPGYDGDDQTIETLVTKASEIGFPVVVKAAAGGGGRGMKVLRDSGAAAELIGSAKREALSAFGSDKVFLEKYFERAKHIEFQIFGDCTGHVFHLFDRECSVQRKHQKIIEEAVTKNLTIDLRKQMGETSVLLAEAAHYQNAGTVEFLLQDGKFYFLEVNTRLQVEHPVTEMVVGMDLVKAQILTAQGRAVFSDKNLFAYKGHAIECRIYAEDPYLGGVPSTGKLGFCHFPAGAGRRFEIGFESHDTITPFYDPMIAKIIVWDETRPRAIQKIIRTLKDTVIFGVKTNIPYLIKILSHPEFVNGTMTTQFINQHFSKPLVAPELSEAEKHLAKLASTTTSAGITTSSPFESGWRIV